MGAAERSAGPVGNGDGVDLGELRRFDVQGPAFNMGGVCSVVDSHGFGAGGTDVQGEAAGDALVFHFIRVSVFIM